MAFSPVTRKLLLEYGTQAKLARRFRVSEAYISSVVSGEDIPKTRRGWVRYTKVQSAIAEYLGVTLEEAFQPHELDTTEEALVA